MECKMVICFKVTLQVMLLFPNDSLFNSKQYNPIVTLQHCHSNAAAQEPSPYVIHCVWTMCLRLYLNNLHCGFLGRFSINHTRVGKLTRVPCITNLSGDCWDLSIFWKVHRLPHYDFPLGWKDDSGELFLGEVGIFGTILKQERWNLTLFDI